jgi:hypothetical protein
LVQDGEDFKACNGRNIDTHFTTREACWRRILLLLMQMVRGEGDEDAEKRRDMGTPLQGHTKRAACLEGILAIRRSELFYLGKCIYGRKRAGLPLLDMMMTWHGAEQVISGMFLAVGLYGRELGCRYNDNTAFVAMTFLMGITHD